MKVRKGQSQPEVVAAAFLILYMVLGRPFKYRVVIVTQMDFGPRYADGRRLGRRLSGCAPCRAGEDRGKQKTWLALGADLWPTFYPPIHIEPGWRVLEDRVPPKVTRFGGMLKLT